LRGALYGVSCDHNARAASFFGGHLPQAWDEEDARLGWNGILEPGPAPVVEEIGTVPLYPP